MLVAVLFIMASLAQIRNLRKCKNQFRHKWIDKGKRDTGCENYDFVCKKCKKGKIKSSTYSSSYYDENGEYIGNTAPECQSIV